MINTVEVKGDVWMIPTEMDVFGCNVKQRLCLFGSHRNRIKGFHNSISCNLPSMLYFQVKALITCRFVVSMKN